MDDAAREVGVNFIGGYSALVQKGMTESDRRLIESLPEALSTTCLLYTSSGHKRRKGGKKRPRGKTATGATGRLQIANAARASTRRGPPRAALLNAAPRSEPAAVQRVGDGFNGQFHGAGLEGIVPVGQLEQLEVAARTARTAQPEVILPGGGAVLAHAAVQLEHAHPVSYTHLDVYKRQRPCRCHCRTPR